MKKSLLTLCCSLALLPVSWAGSLAPADLYQTLRNRVFTVKDYKADVVMNIRVSFMKIPQLRGKLYFKSPDKLKLVREGGLSILPHRTANMSLAGLLPVGHVTVIDAGNEEIDGKSLRVLKVVPESDAGDIVLTKLWVDEDRMLILRSETTTRDNGTFLMNLRFGNFIAYALPDEIQLQMDVKDYKMPKGVTMDYEGNAIPEKVTTESKGRRKKGTINIHYNSYEINTGIDDAFFKEKKK